MSMVPKICGGDIELANFLVGVERSSGTGHEASRLLLREVSGHPLASPIAATASYDPQDWGRKYLSAQGGCCYCDLDHFEVCLPEVRSARDHVAAWHALLRIAQAAQRTANERLPRGQSIRVLANNSDGFSHSYGSHLNFLVSRRAWNNIFQRKLQYLLFLASFQASSIVIAGQGKVGAENEAPDVRYQLSQRADFLEVLCGEQTTYRRPLVNARDEPLCGPGNPSGRSAGLARLHCIFFDSTLCHVASMLKVGLMQIALAMIEAEEVDPRLVLEDAVDAVGRWSHDPSLRATARLVSGGSVTAVELQEQFLEHALRFAARRELDEIVPGIAEILHLWADTLTKLAAGDLDALAPRLDWVRKLHAIERARAQRPQVDWSSPALKHLDLLYSSLDPSDGLYWAYEKCGAVERIVGEEEIARFVDEPPADTRAWGRAMLLRRLDPLTVSHVDWDTIAVRRGPWYAPRYRRIELGSPLCSTRAEIEPILESATDDDDLLDGLGAVEMVTSTPSTDQIGHEMSASDRPAQCQPTQRRFT